MDKKSKEKVARELIKIAKDLVANSIGDYDDDEELADDLESALKRFISGSSDVNNNEILFYETETRGGEGVDIRIYVNPRNQPKKDGQVKIGLTIEGNYESSLGTLEDGVWGFKDSYDIKYVAAGLFKSIKKILRKW